jgi:hypothetical protein
MEVSDASNGQLRHVCRKLPSDFEPYGERKWEGKRHEKPDCSICRWFQPLLRPGQLDWGTCANPLSPRAGLLTFWEQGCGKFEPEKEAASEETRRTRSEFKNRVEDMLRDTLGEFTKSEVAKLNKPFTDDEFHVFRHEDNLDTLLFSQIPCLFRHTPADFDRLQAAEEMAAETLQDGRRFWELARRSLARWLKWDASAIRLSDNTNGLEEEFGTRLRAVFTETLWSRIHETATG